jgi:hypothetical protein
METKKVTAKIDLYPGESYKRSVRWNMLSPKEVTVTVVSDAQWVELEIDGQKYITDRSILKGIL